MPWARASALDRHLACPATSHLPIADRGKWYPGYLAEGRFFSPGADGKLELTPQSAHLYAHLHDDNLPEPAEKSTFAADWGVAMHAAIAGAPDAQDPWLDWAVPWRDILWPRALGEHEVAVSWDCRTKSLEVFRADTEDERTAWKMTRGPDCVVGTCDWWARLPTGEPWVDDLGTGWKPKDPSGPQNLFYLMCRAKAPDVAEWVAQHGTGRSSITHWPRKSGEPSEPTRDGLWRQFGAATLIAFEEDLHWAWVRAHGLNPAPRPGPHCKWCPSAQVCPRANE